MYYNRHTEEMGPLFVEPVTDTIESIYDGMVGTTPVIFLLSIGADPTESIENLARKRKLPSPAVISMGKYILDIETLIILVFNLYNQYKIIIYCFE